MGASQSTPVGANANVNTQPPASSSSSSSQALPRTASQEALYQSSLKPADGAGKEKETEAPVANGRWSSFKATLTDNRVVNLVSTLFSAVKTGFFKVCEFTRLSTLCNRIKSLFGFGKTEETKGKGPAVGGEKEANGTENTENSSSSSSSANGTGGEANG